MKKTRGLYLFLILLGLLTGCSVQPPPEEPVPPKPTPVVQVAPTPEVLPEIPLPEHTPESLRAQKDFSFGYWLNGWRQQEDDPSPDILCFETGHFGLSLDVADLRATRFGLFDDSTDYAGALAQGADRLQALEPARLNFDVLVEGELYRAISCKAGNDKGTKHLRSARLWESGRLVQHFDLQEVVLQNRKGDLLECNATLELVAWPDSLAITAEVTPGVLYEDGLQEGVNGNGYCVMTRPLEIPHKDGMDHAAFTLEAWVKIPTGFADDHKGYLLCKNGNMNTKGHIGFYLDHGLVSATMNLEGGRKEVQQIRQREDAFHLDNWNHLVFTYDGRYMRFYINGNWQAQRQVDQPRIPGKGKLLVGKGPQPHDAISRGVYDQILIWNRALPQEEVKKHSMNARKMPDRTGLTYMQLFKSRRRIREDAPVWKNAAIGLQLQAGDHNWKEVKKIGAPWQTGDPQSLTLACDLRESAMPMAEVSVQVQAPGSEAQPASFDPVWNGYYSLVEDIDRSWKTGYVEIRDYDELTVVVENTGEAAQQVPLLIELLDVANITGLCPILCDREGRPTGIPVQLSKNWHYLPLGNYLRAGMLVPAPPGKTRYRLRIPYGFYGTLPSASHAQLSLVGYGGNGRWDQLAVGCWGETMCFDMDMSCVNVTVTDVRLLMGRNGLEGKSWGWTDAGWGGDWLHAQDDQGEKLYPRQWKTAYLAHGPCLTEVKYTGQYGPKGSVDAQATIQTLRTDDYARTFQQIHYRANEEAGLAEGWLFKMGRTHNYSTPHLAYGNRDGVELMQEIPTTLKRGQPYVDRITLKGEGPWWVTFPGGGHVNQPDKASGTRALIIRSYEARFGGETYRQPTISLPVHSVTKEGGPNLDLQLMPPRGVSGFQPGDEVKLDIEWMTLPRVADDYYGPNKAFRKALTDHPNSWEPVYREVMGNDLKVKVNGGRLKQSYPIIVQSTGPKVVVDIKGGVGMVPLRIEGLHAATGYTLYQQRGRKLIALDQSAHGNDFWQTDYDAASNSWTRTYNLPLDGLAKSTWVLQFKPE